jgi:alpha-beta hydrolase superfamily lysophospholipase
MARDNHPQQRSKKASIQRLCKIVLACLSQAAILLLAFRSAHSTGEFLVLGLGPALLLDRYVFRWLPWSYPLTFLKELALRATYVGLGGIGYSLALAGIIRVEEAFSLGIALSLAAFLFECFFCLATKALRPVLRWCSVGFVRQLEFSIFNVRSVLPSSGRSAPPSYQSMLARPRRPAAWTPLPHLLFLCPAIVYALPLFALHMPRSIPDRTPAALGLPFEDVRFKTCDGLQLGGWLVPHEHARGSILFCHGHGKNRGQVLGFLHMLHDLRLNVLAFDFRGHGDSPGHTETFGQREIHDLVAAEGYIRQRFPTRPIFLVGISYGAAVALQALPELLHVRAAWSEGCFSRFRSVIEHKFCWLPSFLRRPVVTSYKVLAWLDCGFWEHEINPMRRIAHTHVPIYFCHGMEDELIPFADGQALYEAYTGPKWHYWVENASHDSVRQRAPTEYWRRLCAFFEAMLAETDKQESDEETRRTG